MVGGGVHDVPEDFEAAPYIRRAFKNSECRVPVIAALRDGDPLLSVAKLARDVGSALWTIEVKDEKSEQNALDYIEVGLNNGDWVYLTGVECASQAVLRKIALQLSTLKPDPRAFPRRGYFRLWLIFQEHISLDTNVEPLLPQLLSQHCIVAYSSSSATSDKWVKRLPQEPELFQLEMTKHQERRDEGRQSDSESDIEEDDHKIVGKWFSRAVEFHNADEGSSVSRSSAEIFEIIKADDFEKLADICRSGQVNLPRQRHPISGMTPLQYAVSNERINSAKVLLDFGADPNQARDSDGCPLLFMAIESVELFHILVEAGANIDSRFEGFTLEKHPMTAPHIAELVRKMRL